MIKTLITTMLISLPLFGSIATDIKLIKKIDSFRVELNKHIVHDYDFYETCTLVFKLKDKRCIKLSTLEIIEINKKGI